MVKLGIDPRADKLKARAVEAAETFGSMLPLYLKRKGEGLRPRSMIEITRHLSTNARPLHDLALAKIGRRDVAGLITKLADSSGPVAANRIGSTISAYLMWLVREGLIEHHPALGMNKMHETTRDRVLTADELRQLWRATGDASDYSAIVRLLALTSLRRGEVGGLRWTEVDFDRDVISLPGQRTKNAHAFELPMSAPVRAILEARKATVKNFTVEKRVSPAEEFIFPGEAASFDSWTISKTALDKRLAIEPGWTLHDLRRTVATNMGNLGFEPHVVEACLNHQGSKKGVAGVYNRAIYTREKRHALSAWAEHLAAIVEGRAPASNVVALRG
jgi:integrase